MAIRKNTIGTRIGSLQIKMTQDYNTETDTGHYRYVIEELPKRHIVCVGQTINVEPGPISLETLEACIRQYQEPEH